MRPVCTHEKVRHPGLSAGVSVDWDHIADVALQVLDGVTIVVGVIAAIGVFVLVVVVL